MNFIEQGYSEHSSLIVKETWVKLVALTKGQITRGRHLSSSGISKTKTSSQLQAELTQIEILSDLLSNELGFTPHAIKMAAIDSSYGH